MTRASASRQYLRLDTCATSDLLDIGASLLARRRAREASRRTGAQETWEGRTLTLRELPEATRRELETLGAHGWYLDPELTAGEVQEFIRELESVSAPGEQGLIDHYRERLSGIRADLENWFPARAEALAAAFSAHGQGEFYLSIPVFLIQADGICKDLLKTQLYARRPRKSATPSAAAYFGLDLGSFGASLLHPFELSLPIWASESERKRRPCGLNRHAVLHGESLDYGTEVNSLKSISLLYYVAWTLRLEASERANARAAAPPKSLS